jgi:hypothetical protein
MRCCRIPASAGAFAVGGALSASRSPVQARPRGRELPWFTLEAPKRVCARPAGARSRTCVASARRPKLATKTAAPAVRTARTGPAMPSGAPQGLDQTLACQTGTVVARSRSTTSCAKVRAFRTTPIGMRFPPRGITGRSARRETVAFCGTLAVQSLSPIATSWIAMAGPDPLAVAEIRFRNLVRFPASGDLGLDHRAHDGLGSIRCAARLGMSLEARNPAIFAILDGEPDQVLRPDAQEHRAVRAGVNAQPRAPPQLS